MTPPLLMSDGCSVNADSLTMGDSVGRSGASGFSNAARPAAVIDTFASTDARKSKDALGFACLPSPRAKMSASSAAVSGESCSSAAAQAESFVRLDSSIASGSAITHLGSWAISASAVVADGQRCAGQSNAGSPPRPRAGERRPRIPTD